MTSRWRGTFAWSRSTPQILVRLVQSTFEACQRPFLQGSVCDRSSTYKASLFGGSFLEFVFVKLCVLSTSFDDTHFCFEEAVDRLN